MRVYVTIDERVQIMKTERKPKLSIIIPVYNASVYLRQCLNSVVGQDYSNLEIIVIDDGSTDDSLLIAKDFASLDSRIQVIPQINTGPSAARNLGLRFARGKYVEFVDADDLLKSDAVSSTVRCAEDSGADVVCFDFESFDDNGIYGRTVKNEFPCCKNSTSKECLMFMYSEQLGYFSWSFLFKKAIFTDASIGYPEDIDLLEDMLMINMLFRMNLRIAYLPEAVYRYRIVPESLSHRKSLKKAEDGLLVIEKVIEMSRSDQTISVFAPNAVGLLLYIDRIAPIGISRRQFCLHRRIKKNILYLLKKSKMNNYSIRIIIKIIILMYN